MILSIYKEEVDILDMKSVVNNFINNGDGLYTISIFESWYASIVCIQSIVAVMDAVPSEACSCIPSDYVC